MNKIKEIDHDTCRSRSDIRSSKDIYRLSTSNLSKNELEDAYYSILENNLELKKTINTQKDQIKVLTTRVRRLTQINIYSPQKGCSKNTLNEHKEIIIDLKQANEKLVKRVRLLDMQLCSAKQFVKRNPLQTTKCQNCANIRNSSSITLLNTKRSQANLRTKSTASQYEPDITPILLEETIKDSTPNKAEEECTQNKCKTAVEELQLKIENLQKELSKVIDEQSNESKKFIDFENVMCSLKAENLRVRSQARVCDEKLQLQRKEYQELLKKLRTVEAQNETLSLELILEKQKSKELETELKAAEISHNIVDALTKAAARANESREPVRVDESVTPMRFHECLTTMRVDESLTPMGVDESVKPIGIECLTPAKPKSSHIPVRVNESVTPVRVDESPENGDTPNKVEQSDDSGYLDATNKFLELIGDTKLDKITEQAKEEKTTKKAISDDFKRKKRKDRSKKNKRDSSIEASVDGNPSSLSSKDVSETQVDLYNKDNNTITEDIKQLKNNIGDHVIVRKTLQDVGIQSTVKYVSRAVGDVLDGARTDSGVQTGDSICAMADIDTRTYSRKSNRTYSVRGAPAPADNTECEISSLSELPSERDLTSSDYISPGEAVTSSEDTGASSWSELSEGELPVARHKLSYGEVDANMSVGEHKPPISPGVRIDRAMKMAKEEADRIAHLLAGRPVDLQGVTVNPMALLRARY